MDPISKKLITLMLLGFSIGFVSALFIFPIQVHITATCQTNNKVMLNQYRTIIRDVDLRLVGCEDIAVKISRPNLYEVLFKKEPEVVNTELSIVKEGIAGTPSGGEGGGGEGSGGEGSVTYTLPEEEVTIIPIPTRLEIFDLCSPTKAIETMKWCLNKYPPYDITFKDEEDTITVTYTDGDKVESYALSRPFTFAHLYVKNVKDIPEPYVIRIVGPSSNYFSVGTISKSSTILYGKLTEVMISIPIIYDSTLSFPTSTDRNDLQLYMETENGHQLIGTLRVYFQS